MVEVPIAEALDLVAFKMKETIDAQGMDSIAIYGSGQWTIPDGSVASKFMKGCVGTNNLKANARLCMASAVTGFLTSFGMDEPMGAYQDIDHAGVFGLWGNNMAEIHPVLFWRMLEQPNAQATRHEAHADRCMMFRPQTDLAIANAICHELLHTAPGLWCAAARSRSRSTAILAREFQVVGEGVVGHVDADLVGPFGLLAAETGGAVFPGVVDVPRMVETDPAILVF